MLLFALPPRLTVTKQLGLSLLVGTWAILVYGIAGQISSELDPALLQISAWDRAVPFVPWTFWVYFSVNFIYLASCALQKPDERFQRFLLGYFSAYLISAVWFVVVPTTFPRELYPLPESTDAFTRLAMTWFRSVDHPSNCLPSMHVASSVMSTLPLYKKSRRVFALFFVWAVSIAFTTLTTKQHYLVDVLAGGAFGVTVHLLAQHLRIPTKNAGTTNEKAPDH